jgi:hypothetical protein
MSYESKQKTENKHSCYFLLDLTFRYWPLAISLKNKYKTLCLRIFVANSGMLGWALNV